MTQATPVAKQQRNRINPAVEKGYSIYEFGKAVDPPVHYDTVNAWINEGLKSNRGCVVKLKTFRGTRGRRTTMEAYWRFIDELNDD